VVVGPVEFEEVAVSLSEAKASASSAVKNRPQMAGSRELGA